MYPSGFLIFLRSLGSDELSADCGSINETFISSHLTKKEKAKSYCLMGLINLKGPIES